MKISATILFVLFSFLVQAQTVLDSIERSTFSDTLNIISKKDLNSNNWFSMSGGLVSLNKGDTLKLERCKRKEWNVLFKRSGKVFEKFYICGHSFINSSTLKYKSGDWTLKGQILSFTNITELIKLRLIRKESNSLTWVVVSIEEK